MTRTRAFKDGAAPPGIEPGEHGQTIYKLKHGYFIEKSIVESGKWALYSPQNKFCGYVKSEAEALKLLPKITYTA